MESRNAFVSSSVADECSVIIGHASPAYLYGLEAIIDAIPGLHVTASARTRSELLTHCAAMRSGIVMVDAELGEAQIDSQVRDLMTAAPNIRVMLMLATPLPVNVRVAIETGALGEDCHAGAHAPAALHLSAGGRTACDSVHVYATHDARVGRPRQAVAGKMQ